MDVILRETVAKLGRAGEVITVKNGYARNYLIPKGLAYHATEQRKRQVAAEAKRQSAKLVQDETTARDVADSLGAVELHFTVKTGEGDKIFGSITTGDIAEQLAAQGFEFDRRAIELEAPIKSIGVFKVPVRLHQNVHAEIRVWVVRE